MPCTYKLIQIKIWPTISESSGAVWGSGPTIYEFIVVIYEFIGYIIEVHIVIILSIQYLHLIALKGKYRYLLLVFVVADFGISRHLPIDEHLKILGFPASISNNSTLCQTSV